MKKKILVISGILIVVMAAGIVLYQVIKNDSTRNSNNPEATYGSDFVSVDKDGDLGTARVVNKDQVSDALGDKGSEISGPELSSVLRLGTIKSQTATYTFKMANGKQAKVNIDARTYPSAKEMGDIPFLQTEPAAVDGIGDKARFLIPDEKQVLGNNTTLMVTKGKTSFAVNLEQERGDATIDTQTARDIILKVAKVAKFDEVKE